MNTTHADGHQPGSVAPIELAQLYPQSAESIRIAFPEAFQGIWNLSQIALMYREYWEAERARAASVVALAHNVAASMREAVNASAERHGVAKVVDAGEVIRWAERLEGQP